MKVPFARFLHTAFDKGFYTAEDVTGFVLPLLQQVAAVHAAGKVVSWQGNALYTEAATLAVETDAVELPRHNLAAVQRLLQAMHSPVVSIADSNVPQWMYDDASQPLTQPAYVLGYRCYEQLLQHHDTATDVFVCGLVLASVAMGLDLNQKPHLERFVAYRNSPVLHHAGIHPVIAALIIQMTSLDRQQRGSLQQAIERLQHYRAYDPDNHATGWDNDTGISREQYILQKLRNRLFDTTKRNRLLYYKSNLRFANLTIGSVPLVQHPEHIQPSMLFIWNDDISKKVSGMKEIALNKYLRLEQHVYLGNVLNKIKAETHKDIQEYGFSQLKLVIAFLNWHNLKEEKELPIQSPLLLIPVELYKRKALTDYQYALDVLDNHAEVNPVLAQYLKGLYGIRLPEFIDLDETSLPDFFATLKEQIDACRQGIELVYIDKPQIELVYEDAQAALHNYQRKLGKPSPEQERMITVRHKQKAMNPYRWEMDTCNIVLGNFHYKKMSLVSDYNTLAETTVEHAVFQQLFGNQPKSVAWQNYDVTNPAEWNHVVTADPTQTKAILQSRAGESFIIQGPPGTGKSQTSTNLVADYVARGKRILFVCEKRAALDVVYYRLRQQGLDELCCYIHDSQTDKRAFVQDLKATYEDFTSHAMDYAGISIKRNKALEQLRLQVTFLDKYHATGHHFYDKAGLRVRELIDQLVNLQQHLQPLSVQQQEQLPYFHRWQEFGNVLERLHQALDDSGAAETFAEHPFSKVNEQVFLQQQPASLLAELTENIQHLLLQITAVMERYKVPQEQRDSFQQLKSLIQDAVLLQPLAANNHVQLANAQTQEHKAFEQQVKQHKQLQEQQSKLTTLNSNWNNKFSEADTQQALGIAHKYETSFFRFLSGNWRRLKKQMQLSYNFRQHQLPPSITHVLEQLQQEYTVTAQLHHSKQQFEQQYQIDNIDVVWRGIEALRNKHNDKEIGYLLSHPEANQLVNQLYQLNNVATQLEIQLQQCLRNPHEKPLQQVQDELESIILNVDTLKVLLPALQSYAQLPADVKQAISSLPLTAIQAQAAMAFKTWEHILHHNRDYATADITGIEQSVQQIERTYKHLLQLNAAFIRATVRKRFTEHIELSQTAVSQLTAEQKEWKKTYSEGRRILENEFGKTMRYKSIRELATKESSEVLKDIRPVWLMSPMSVSDSLPLRADMFDVVIFDEASQITLEEGIPALFRAGQVIIVGDEMQMPPTNFFNARGDDPDDIDTSLPEEETFDDDADSLLVQGARKLNSVMLGWHYRSRYETLIGYSNHAFYNKGLLTVPDQSIHTQARPEILVQEPGDAVQLINEVLHRSISYHYLPNGIYEKRSNKDEAAYIAQMVRALLTSGVQDSIGIVAFSKEQQSVIEDALDALADADPAFEQQLEAAYNRTEDDQFIGLIVKNLENIQGDERDIIIMSVCYGFDSNKKMLMNFGPINKRGGEKRLNVIFSRAKKHMVVVSSIQHQHITNVHNAGANYFKRFLHYAQMVSVGNMQAASTILHSLVANKQLQRSTTQSPIALQIREKLAAKGFAADLNIGQSVFTCPLAVKRNVDDTHYTLAILIDDEQHYTNDNWLEQYFQRPAILKAFGWKVITVYAKDWLQQPDYIMQQLLLRLTDDSPMEAEVTDTDSSTNATYAATQHADKNLTFITLYNTETAPHKFWQVAVDGNKMIVRYGKKDTKGQTQVKTFADSNTAYKEADKQVKDKLSKGYTRG